VACSRHSWETYSTFSQTHWLELRGPTSKGRRKEEKREWQMEKKREKIGQQGKKGR